jgi:hypothetical protein
MSCRNKLITICDGRPRTDQRDGYCQFIDYAPRVEFQFGGPLGQAVVGQGICSTRLNDGFPFQHSANRLIRIEPATCCGANDGSNGSEKIGTPV